MSDLIDTIKDLGELTKQLDANQRALLLEAVFKVGREERTAVLGELVESALAKWETFKAAAKAKPPKGAAKTPAFSLAQLKSKVVATAKSTREAIAERGAVAVLKDATSSLGAAVATLGRVRTEVGAILDGESAGARDRTRRALVLAKTLGFGALILIDRAQRTKSDLKGDAAQMVDRLSTILLAEEALIAVVVLQLGASILKRAEAHLPQGEPARLACRKALDLYEVFSSVGAEYLMTLEIKGLDGSGPLEILDTQGRRLLHAELGSEADRAALAAARRMTGGAEA